MARETTKEIKMAKALDIIFGTIVLTTAQFANIATRKAAKAFLNSFNNVNIIKVAAVSKFVPRDIIDAYSVTGSTAYLVDATKFAVDGIVREGGFNAIASGNGRWLIVRAKGLKVS